MCVYPLPGHPSPLPVYTQMPLAAPAQGPLSPPEAAWAVEVAITAKAAYSGIFIANAAPGQFLCHL